MTTNFGPLPDEKYVSYGNLLDTFPAEALLQVDDDDYQGDSRVLLADGDRRGFLTFGWGSCSGCDALEACADRGEQLALRNELWDAVHWEDNAADMVTHLRGIDWDLRFGSGARFGRDAIALLEGKS